METNRMIDAKPYKTLINELEEIVDKQTSHLQIQSPPSS